MSHVIWSLRAPAAACALASFLTLLESSHLNAEERTPQSLVKAALETELNGPSQLRGQLLAEALQLDPDYAPARWHSGYVRWDNQWVKIDDVPRLARSNERLTQYRKKRDAMVDTADQHRELARWCHKNSLPDEERVHWAKVLEFEPGDAEAIAALGLQLHGGRLLTKQQISQEKDRAAEAQRAMRHWQPKLVKWRRAIEGPRSPQRTEAVRELKELDDPAAIPALEAVLATNATSAKAVELNRLLIETVGRMPVPEATQVLLRRSLIHDSLEVREPAIAQLKLRPMFAYVPQLIAMFPKSLKTRLELTQMPDGALLRREEISLEDSSSEFFLSRETFELPTVAIIPQRQTWRFLLPSWIDARMEQEQTEAVAREYRDQAEVVHSRIQYVLEAATGIKDATDPILWERQWNDYNGWYNSPHPMKKYYRLQESQVIAPAPVVLRSSSCFPTGTPVLTSTGPKSIEQIKTGDLVLSQNPRNGELAYKAVELTTIRPPVPLLSIEVGSEHIQLTRGHPIWLNGQGWRVAKFLKPGDKLHGINGMLSLTNVESRPEQEVYNLVVAQWHNYFVGDSRILVHDNSPLEQVPSIVPGLDCDSELAAVVE